MHKSFQLFEFGVVFIGLFLSYFACFPTMEYVSIGYNSWDEVEGAVFRMAEWSIYKLDAWQQAYANNS